MVSVAEILPRVVDLGAQRFRHNRDPIAKRQKILPCQLAQDAGIAKLSMRRTMRDQMISMRS